MRINFEWLDHAVMAFDMMILFLLRKNFMIFVDDGVYVFFFL